MMLNNILSRKSGFTLVEIIISTTMFAILAVGITVMLVPTMNVFRESNESTERLMLMDYLQDEITNVLTSASTPDPTLNTETSQPSITVDGNKYTTVDGYYYVNDEVALGEEFYHGNFVAFEFKKVAPPVGSSDYIVETTIHLYDDEDRSGDLDTSVDTLETSRTFYVNMPLVQGEATVEEPEEPLTASEMYWPYEWTNKNTAGYQPGGIEYCIWNDVWYEAKWWTSNEPPSSEWAEIDKPSDVVEPVTDPSSVPPSSYWDPTVDYPAGSIVYWQPEDEKIGYWFKNDSYTNAGEEPGANPDPTAAPWQVINHD